MRHMAFDSSVKQEYRQRMYDAVEQAQPQNPVWKRRVAYLEHSLALESLYLLRRGYLPGNLWAFNYSPGILAAANRTIAKAGFLHVHTQACDIRTVQDGFDIINYDSMGNISAFDFAFGLRYLATRTRVLGVNVMAGRELHFPRGRKPSHVNRLRYILYLLSAFGPRVLDSDVYISPETKQPMLWACLKLETAKA